MTTATMTQILARATIEETGTRRSHNRANDEQATFEGKAVHSDDPADLNRKLWQATPSLHLEVWTARDTDLAARLAAAFHANEPVDIRLATAAEAPAWLPVYVARRDSSFGHGSGEPAAATYHIYTRGEAWDPDAPPPTTIRLEISIDPRYTEAAATLDAWIAAGNALAVAIF